MPLLYRIWCALPLVDRESGSLSITRCMATLFAWLDCYSIIHDTAHAITSGHVALAIACLAAAFGKSTFGFFLTRYSMQAQDSNTTVDTHTTQEIIKRREVGGDFEPTP